MKATKAILWFAVIVMIVLLVLMLIMNIMSNSRNGSPGVSMMCDGFSLTTQETTDEFRFDSLRKSSEKEVNKCST